MTRPLVAGGCTRQIAQCLAPRGFKDCLERGRLRVAGAVEPVEEDSRLHHGDSPGRAEGAHFQQVADDEVVQEEEEACSHLALVGLQTAVAGLDGPDPEIAGAVPLVRLPFVEDVVGLAQQIGLGAGHRTEVGHVVVEEVVVVDDDHFAREHLGHRVASEAAVGTVLAAVAVVGTVLVVVPVGTVLAVDAVGFDLAADAAGTVLAAGVDLGALESHTLACRQVGLECQAVVVPADVGKGRLLVEYLRNTGILGAGSPCLSCLRFPFAFASRTP